MLLWHETLSNIYQQTCLASMALSSLSLPNYTGSRLVFSRSQDCDLRSRWDQVDCPHSSNPAHFRYWETEAWWGKISHPRWLREPVAGLGLRSRYLSSVRSPGAGGCSEGRLEPWAQRTGAQKPEGINQERRSLVRRAVQLKEDLGIPLLGHHPLLPLPMGPARLPKQHLRL